MMQGTIQQAQMSKSGKTLRILVNDQWYSTSNFALQNAVGRNIQFEVGTSEYQGNVIYWANDAELVTNVAPNIPAATPQAAPSSPTGTVRDRDASIIAQALTKACTAPGDVPDAVWERYCFFYAKALAGEKPVDNPDFDDDIPF